MAITTLQDFSKTAFMSGATRATHLMWDDAPHVLDDPYSALLFPNEFGEWVQALLTRPDSPINAASRVSVIWRARTTEDALEAAMAGGISQYAILGAGLDSFAWRRADLLERLQVYELDHPATQDGKRQALAAAGFRHPAGLHFVPADLANTRLRDALARSAWDFSRPGFFCWTGVTMYLQPEAVLAALRDIAALGPGTTVSFTYLQPEHALEGLDADVLRLIRKASNKVGEGYYSYYTPGEIEEVARQAGFSRIEHHDPRTSPHFAGRRDGLMPHRAELLVVATA
jgi:methyltransferase (TIGR00027 family)